MTLGILPFRRLVVLSVFLSAAACPFPVQGAKFNRKVDVGSRAPSFVGLMGVDGRAHSLSDYKSAKIVVIAFMANECAVSALYEDRFVQFVKERKPQGVEFVGISCSLLPGDGLEKMKARSAERHYNFDYLFDPSQATGRSYGATVTPQLFVLDQNRKIAYMGNFDDHIEPDRVRRKYVESAVRALLDGKKPDPDETRAQGCGIEYGKRQDATKGSDDESR